jgi:hypothetical protein
MKSYDTELMLWRKIYCNFYINKDNNDNDYDDVDDDDDDDNNIIYIYIYIYNPISPSRNIGPLWVFSIWLSFWQRVWSRSSTFQPSPLLTLNFQINSDLVGSCPEVILWYLDRPEYAQDSLKTFTDKDL